MRLVNETSSIPRLLVFPLLALALFGLFWLRYQPGVVFQLAHCPLMQCTGIPCPTCGGTHSMAALSIGDWDAALGANPLVAITLIIFVIWAIWAILATVLPPLRYAADLSLAEKRAVKILAALLLLLAWARQIALVVA